MTEYIKMIITAIITGIAAPLPVSSSAHYNFVSNVVGFATDSKIMSVYFGGFLIAFSLVIFLSYRKLFIGCLKAMFVTKKNTEKREKTKGHRQVLKNLLLSILPTLLLFIPVSKEKLLIDYFDNFLNLNSVILSGFACIVTSCILIIALWYTGKNRNKGDRITDAKTTLRLSFYQLPCYIIPGLSHIASGAVNLLICDVKNKTYLSELYVYIAPSMLIVGAVKLIRSFAVGILFDPIILIVGVVVFALAAKLIISLTAKFSLRRLFGFFAGYSFVFGIFIAIASFYI